mmetsp:Transcript_90785/g.256378  ORF Transcript_90785/g.256378 Transcript_90785/m.256378 type:complete len:360 (+) Transcript_90785:323-1402(+)
MTFVSSATGFRALSDYALNLLPQLVDLPRSKFFTGSGAFHQVRVLRAATSKRLDVHTDDIDTKRPEDFCDAADEAGVFLDNAHEHHCVRMVQLIAEGDLGARMDNQRQRLRILRGTSWLRALGVLMRQAKQHCIVHSRKKPVLADEMREPRLAHRLLDAVPHHGERHLDATVSKVLHDVLEHMHGCRVDADHWCHLEDNVLRRVDFIEVADICQQHILDERRVCKVHRRPDAADEHVPDERARTLLLHVAVNRRPGDAPQDRDLRPERLVDYDHQGNANRHQETSQDSQEQGAEERHHPKEEILPFYPEQFFCVADGHEWDHRVNHDSGQRELGQIIKESSQDHQRHEHDCSGDDARKL